MSDLPNNAEKGSKGKAEKQTAGRGIEYPEIGLWHSPVDGNQLFNEMDVGIKSHMAMTDTDRRMAILWTAHTHCYDAFMHSPRLAISAPDKECGKTVLMGHIIGNLVPQPQHSDNLTPAVFFRLAESHKPTFLIDEVDAWLKEDSHLPSALNGGFERHGGVLRCEGDKNEVRKFSTFAPTAMAGIKLDKKLPPATLSRSYIIKLQRAMPNEVSVPFDQRKHVAQLHEFRSRLARWIDDNWDAICESDPEIPALNRLADRMRPLFIIADLVGGYWPKYAKRAITNTQETNSKGETLIQDIASIIDLPAYAQNKGIWTDDLIDELCGLEDSIWAEYNFRNYGDEKNIGPRQLSNLLVDYGVKPKDLKIDGVTKRGYRFDGLKNVIARFTQHPPVLSATPLPCSDTNGFRENLSATPQKKVADRNSPKANDTNESSGVADGKGEYPRLSDYPGGDEEMLAAGFSPEQIIEAYARNE